MKRKLNFSEKKSDREVLKILLENGPLSWALIRANEIKSLEGAKFKSPVLDVGCGDGVVAKVIKLTNKENFQWGIDLSPSEIEKAKKSGSYKRCKVANIYKLAFKNDVFNTVFSNSVVEHLTNLDGALSEISRVLAYNGKFIMTVPTPYLSRYLLGYRFFKYFKLDFLAELYAKFFNSLFRHRNLYDHKQWKNILAKNKLQLVDYCYYHSPRIIQTHEIFSYLAMPRHILKLLTGTWLSFLTPKDLLLSFFLKNRGLVYDKEASKKEGGSLLLISKCTG